MATAAPNFLDSGEFDPTMNGTSRMIMNTILSRSHFLQKYMDPRRDYDKECGYKKTEELTAHEYSRLFDRDPISARIVEIFPMESWKTPPSVFEDDNPETKTDFEKSWDEFVNSLKGVSFHRKEETSPLWRILTDADIKSGIGTFGVLLIGFDDLTDEETLAKPLPGFEDGVPEKPTGSKLKVLYTKAFQERDVRISKYNLDKGSPMYRRPIEYEITFNAVEDTSSESYGLPVSTERVHWSRVIHITESDDVFGVPRIRPVYNRVVDLIKLYGGSAEMYWRGAFPGMAINLDPSLTNNVPVDQDSIKEAMFKYNNSLQRWFALAGASAQQLSPQVVDPGSQIEVQIDAICIKLGIPKRIFMGSERGELASSQDADSWAGRMYHRQMTHNIPRILVPFIDRMILAGALPVPKQGYTIEWERPEVLSPQEQAGVASTITTALGSYVSGGVDALIEPMDYLTRVVKFDKEDAENILENRTRTLEDARKEQEKPAESPKKPAQSPQEASGKPEKVPDGQKDAPPDQKVVETQKAAEQKKEKDEEKGKPATQNELTENQETEEDDMDPYFYQDEFGETEYVWPSEEYLTANEKQKLNKPFRTPGGPKKFAVHTKNATGQVVIVRFGDSNMKIKRDDPERLKAFRARHGCDKDPGPKWKPKYWSCRFWEKGKSVTDILNNARAELTDNNCGTGSGGFKAGNKCAVGGGRPKGSTKAPKASGKGSKSAHLTQGGKQISTPVKGKDGKTKLNSDGSPKMTKKWVQQNGKPLPEHIEKLGMPPQALAIRYTTDKNQALLAQWKDQKGRWQPKYSDSHTAKQAAAKFNRTNELIKKKNKILGEVDKDAKNPKLAEEAECLKLVLQTGIRPGSTSDTKTDYKSYGATTLQARHVKTKQNGEVYLRFATGKNKGREVSFEISDKKTQAMLKRRAKAAENGTEPLFNTSSTKLSAYTKTKDGGGFKTKDFRTALGTETAMEMMKTMRKPATAKTYKSQVKRVSEAVAKKLGNTPSVALKSYIDPNIFTDWRID